MCISRKSVDLLLKKKQRKEKKEYEEERQTIEISRGMSAIFHSKFYSVSKLIFLVLTNLFSPLACSGIKRISREKEEEKINGWNGLMISKVVPNLV